MASAPWCQNCRHHHHQHEACPVCGHMPRVARFKEAQALPMLFKLLFSTFESPCLAQPQALALLRQASILRQKVFCRAMGWREDLGSGHEEDQFDTVSLHILATVGDAPVAYGRYRIVAAAGPSGIDAVHLPTLDRLVVHPQYRGRGFGFVLLYKLLQDILGRMATAGAPAFPALRVFLPVSGSGVEPVHAWFSRQSFLPQPTLIHRVDPSGFILQEQYVNERTGAQNAHVCEYHLSLQDPTLRERVTKVVGGCGQVLTPIIRGAAVVPGSGLGLRSGQGVTQTESAEGQRDGCTAYMRLLLHGDPPRQGSDTSLMIDGEGGQDEDEEGPGPTGEGAGAAVGRARREAMYSAQEAQQHYEDLAKIRAEEEAEKAAVHKAFRDQRNAAMRAQYAAEAQRREEEKLAKQAAEGFGHRGWHDRRSSGRDAMD